MKIRFWGVRGSIPCPGPNTVRYGGNTSCIEICFEDLERLIVLDAGSGIRELGNDLMTRYKDRSAPLIEVFVTHTHWDHIQGFPFFAPIYIPNMKIHIYGPATDHRETLQKTIAGQLSYQYFPVRQNELSAEIEYTELTEGHLDLGDGLTVATKYLSHPLRCLGYRFAYQNKTVCTVYDMEPFQNLFSMDPDDPDYDGALVEEGRQAAEDLNQGISDFYSGTDILIHDAQYTAHEYASGRVGWGHSPMDQVVADADKSGVKHLTLFHHDPFRTDAQLDHLAERFCTREKAVGTRVILAREGMEIEV
jgi:phosphoribosyl 1,2-cyclic phosphodiesterase